MSKKARIARYSAAVEALAVAKMRRDVLFRETFPIGSPVQWMHGYYLQSGVVKMFCSEDRLVATNDRTGKDVFVEGYNLLSCASSNSGEANDKG